MLSSNLFAPYSHCNSKELHNNEIVVGENHVYNSHRVIKSRHCDTLLQFSGKMRTRMWRKLTGKISATMFSKSVDVLQSCSIKIKDVFGTRTCTHLFYECSARYWQFRPCVCDRKRGLASWRADRKGTSETDLSSCDRYFTVWPTVRHVKLCVSRHTNRILAVTESQTE